MKECDNIGEAHDLLTVRDTMHAQCVYCVLCRHIYLIRKDGNGNPERREYARLFKRDILQPGENLYYKYHPERLSIL